MSDKGNKVNVHDLQNIMHEMLKFSFRNTSTNISIIDHNLDHKNHIDTHKVIIYNMVCFHKENNTKKN
jgi:hypothetical protein